MRACVCAGVFAEDDWDDGVFVTRATTRVGFPKQTVERRRLSERRLRKRRKGICFFRLCVASRRYCSGGQALVMMVSLAPAALGGLVFVLRRYVGRPASRRSAFVGEHLVEGCEWMFCYGGPTTGGL